MREFRFTIEFDPGADAVAAPLGLIGPVLAAVLGDAGLTLGVTGNALRLPRLTPD